MSTRANIIITDGHNELIFYRHCDGYPDGTLPSLNQFLDLVKTGKIRDNTSQAAGWLILLGNTELKTLLAGRESDLTNWQCGAYEPTTEIHGDIAFLYVVDLQTKTIHIDGQDGFTYVGKFSDEQPQKELDR